jgi:peptidoglycan/xylan/chitin deacetylase (PgdA/CDA1 family)
VVGGLSADGNNSKSTSRWTGYSLRRGKVKRDYVGYGNKPPRLPWPNDATLAIGLIVNYEEGAEYSLAHGDDRQEALGEWGYKEFPPGVRNLANESFFEYGSRVGFWRLMDIFDSHDVQATFGACALALEKNPEAAKAISAAGHEVCSHGYRWEEHYLMTREREKERIRLAVESLQKTTGQRPRGWYCRTAPSLNTRELLIEEGGFLYDSDAYNDDSPYFVEVKGTRHLVIPYTGDVNDTHYWHSPGFETGFFQYLRDSFDYLLRESRKIPRMMSVGLHLRIVGRPGRAKVLSDFIDYARSQPGVWFARRIDIAEHYLNAFPE